jgi:Pyridoxamine-phosphate oxidase
MLNPSYSTEKFLEAADRLLDCALSQHSHPFKTFSVASTVDNTIDQRTVVLRQWVLERRTIMFHTDIRSKKIQQFKNNSSCSCLFYSHEDKLQLRFSAVTHIHYQDRLSDCLFEEMTENQKKMYSSSNVPGDTFLSKGSHVDPYSNFSVCVCNFDYLDLLFLNHQDHKRVAYKWDKQGRLTSSFIVA